MKKTVMVFVAACLVAGAAWAQDKPAAQAKPATQEKPAAAADAISGDWDGTVEMPDGAMPFSLKLKLEKDKVTGELGSQQGAMALTDGSFVDGKLTFSFNYIDGNPVSFSGTVADGAITGSFSYGGGQMVLSCSAKKKVAK